MTTLTIYWFCKTQRIALSVKSETKTASEMHVAPRIVVNVH